MSVRCVSVRSCMKEVGRGGFLIPPAAWESADGMGCEKIIYLNCLYDYERVRRLKGTETPYRPHDQFQLSRRGNTMVTKLPRFKVWISLLKFKVAAKFGVSEESLVNQIPVEDCDGMLRIWDGPLREPPICKDLNWYAKQDTHSPIYIYI